MVADVAGERATFRDTAGETPNMWSLCLGHEFG